MKRFSVLLLILLVGVGAIVSADTSVLIDFATLVDDAEDGQNEATVVDLPLPVIPVIRIKPS